MTVKPGAVSTGKNATDIILCTDHASPLHVIRTPKAPSPVHRPPAVATPELSDDSKYNDYMPIDETRHRVYIHDLDAEIAQIEADENQEQRKLFLPEIEKKLTRVPDRVLQSTVTGGSVQPPNNVNTNTQLVLYRDPTSISVPAEEDAVRRSIIEARRRLRERQEQERKEREKMGTLASTVVNEDPAMTGGNYKGNSDDPDAMDIG